MRIGGSDDDDAEVRITGRFWFDLRELGRNSSGSFNRRCFPQHDPDGKPMTDDLFDYYGRSLLPSLVRYNAGLLGLANRRVTVRTAGATPANGFLCRGNGCTSQTDYTLMLSSSGRVGFFTQQTICVTFVVKKPAPRHAPE